MRAPQSLRGLAVARRRRLRHPGPLRAVAGRRRSTPTSATPCTSRSGRCGARCSWRSSSASPPASSAPGWRGCWSAPTSRSPACGGCWRRCRWCSPPSSAPPPSSPGSHPTASSARCSSSSATTRRDGSAASGASCLVLTAFTYPYVYLPVAARLAALPPSIEESARLLGDRPSRLFFADRAACHPQLGARRDADRVAVQPERVRRRAAARLRHPHPRRLRDPPRSTAPDRSPPRRCCSCSRSSRSRSNADSAARSQHSAPTGLRRNAPVRARSLADPRPGVRGRRAARVARRAGRLARAVGVARHRRRAGPRSPQLGHDLADLRDPAWSTAWLGIVAAVGRRRGGAAGRAADRSLPQPARAPPSRPRSSPASPCRDWSSRSASRSGR